MARMGELPSMETHERMVATAALRGEIVRVAMSVALARATGDAEQEKLAVDLLCKTVATYLGRKKPPSVQQRSPESGK